ncbi:MAG: TetR family transcriptional regulator [Actinomycetales bacterium]
MSLRESKKQQTREGLAAAAVDLIIERGYDATTVEDIAASVPVSPRTFFRYYPTKEDVVVDLLRAGVVDLVHRLEARPAEESLSTALREAALGWADLDEDSATRLLKLSRVLRSSPCLQPRFDRQRQVGVKELEREVARRMGSNEGSASGPPLTVDCRPQLIVTLVSAVLSDAVERWSDGGGREPLTGYVKDGFDLLEFGLPVTRGPA